MKHRRLKRAQVLRSSALVALFAGAVISAVFDSASGHPPATGARGTLPMRASTSHEKAASWPVGRRAGLPLLPAGRFAGSWHVHTQYVVIRPDGTGTATWPIHAWCGTGSAAASGPCDQIISRSGFEQIVPGGAARIQLTRVTGPTANAIIEGSTDPSQLPNGPVTMTVAADDVLTVTTGSGQLAFCGPQAAALSVTQQDAEGINCGA
jgi:hypothetical protein